ncbi:MAG: hypothetical protein L7S67_03495 [Flavobacteriales bacterium]|nr:hypothetical protein [Flavobacteriales bacterium]
MMRVMAVQWGVLMGLLLTFVATGQAQRDRTQSAKYQRKVQMKLKKERDKEQAQAFRNGRKTHWKAQDRSTRKRWRAQRRAAKRMRRGGGPDSWYKGLFKSGRPIPWTKRAANKVGNLFKRKRQRRSY